MADPILTTTELRVTAGPKMLLNPVTLEVPTGGVFGIIGPSGAGKSTFLKCLNRLAELTPGLAITGQVHYRDLPVYSTQTDPDALRERIGILFQQPVVFPGSILHNTLFGVRHLGKVPRREWDATAERALRQASLWDEVKDRLHHPGQQLSVGQQQRLCLARTLANGPDLILMDEPTSALDPRSTDAIEQLVLELGNSHTIVLVTHNLRQAARICSSVAFIGLRHGTGTLLAHGTLDSLQCRADIPELTDYLCCELPAPATTS